MDYQPLINLMEQQLLCLRRVESMLNQISACLPRPIPDYQISLDQFTEFDWASIGASVLESDHYGAAIVSWGGRIYTRRSPSNKFNPAIWFSRCTGKDESGNNAYERLITFKKLDHKAEPLPDRTRAPATRG